MQRLANLLKEKLIRLDFQDLHIFSPVTSFHKNILERNLKNHEVDRKSGPGALFDKGVRCCRKLLFGEGVVNFFHIGDDHKEVNAVSNSDKTSENNASLPILTGISGHEDVPGPGLAFCSNLFPKFFEFNLPRRQVVHYDDTYTSLLNCSPRKEVPVGPEHQADVSEFDSDSARNYISNNDKEESLMGICVILNQAGEIVIYQTDCKCLDGGSIRCVQQHANEARLNLKSSLGLEKFVNLGFNNIGEEVACNWTEEEKLFHDVVYANPVSHGKQFWEELSIAFQSRTKKELVGFFMYLFSGGVLFKTDQNCWRSTVMMKNGGEAKQGLLKSQ